MPRLSSAPPAADIQAGASYTEKRCRQAREEGGTWLPARSVTTEHQAQSLARWEAMQARAAARKARGLL